jgi:hypothetical protein
LKYQAVSSSPFKLNILFTFVTKQATLMRRSTFIELLVKRCLHRLCGPAILPSDAISIENFLSPRHRFEMDIPFEIYAPMN